MFVDHATTEEQIEYHADRCYNTEDHWDRHELVRWGHEVIKRLGRRLFPDEVAYYVDTLKELADGAVLMPCIDYTEMEPKLNRVRAALHELCDIYWESITA